MIESLVYAPHIKSGDRKVVSNLFRATLAAGAPRITNGQAVMARLLVLRYRAQMAGVVIALAERAA